jgi:hypothetical protein
MVSRTVEAMASNKAAAEETNKLLGWLDIKNSSDNSFVSGGRIGYKCICKSDSTTSNHTTTS